MLLLSEVAAVQLHAVSYKYPHTEKIALAEVSYTFSRGQLLSSDPMVLARVRWLSS